MYSSRTPPTHPGDVAFALVGDWQGGLTSVKLSPGFFLGRSRVPRWNSFRALENRRARPFIAVSNRAGGAALRRIASGSNGTAPVFSPDGTRVAFQSVRNGDLSIFSQAVDGTGPAVRLTTAAPGEAHLPHSWSGDLLLYDLIKGAEVRLWQLSVKDGKAAPFGDVRSTSETDAAFSPDGHWVAYSTTDDEHATNLFVLPFPAAGTPSTLLKGRGAAPHHPIWSPTGDALIYTPSPGVMERVGISTAPTVSSAIRKPCRARLPAARRHRDARTNMMPDGRVLGLVTPGQASGPLSQDEIRVVLNSFEELKARVPR